MDMYYDAPEPKRKKIADVVYETTKANCTSIHVVITTGFLNL